jgi:hypothetical protein
LDEEAIFDVDDDPRKVQHSVCLQTKKMKEPYHTTRFEEHLGKCSGPSKAAKKKLLTPGMQTLKAMSIQKNWTAKITGPGPAPKPIVTLSCPGLTPSTVPNHLHGKLKVYLQRSPLQGGGGPTPDQVTLTLFPKKQYQNLTEQQKNAVRSAQRQQYLWRNHANIETVFAASCEKSIQAREGGTPYPCSECTKVLENKRFKQALSIPLPDEKNHKFMPKTLLNETAIEQFARATGLKTILDAHAEVSKYLLQF